MKINIYYGGRGSVGDPTLYVLEKIEAVFGELNVSCTRYNLSDYKTGMSALMPSLKDADAVVLASTLEWFGLGGAMYEFLDSCWMYADKETVSKLYMMPVVLSKTYGEREAKDDLISAWGLIGGKSLEGLCAYVSDKESFENNADYLKVIETAAENTYRCVSKNAGLLPSSNDVIRSNVLKDAIALTPKEVEQLSKYVAKEDYVKTQKKDIAELSGMFKELLIEEENGFDAYYTSPFEKHYIGHMDVLYSIMIAVTDKNKNILLRIAGDKLTASVEDVSNTYDINVSMDSDLFAEIINGRMTFQRAFMMGSLRYKGDFSTIKKLDSLFDF